MSRWIILMISGLVLGSGAYLFLGLEIPQKGSNVEKTAASKENVEAKKEADREAREKAEREAREKVEREAREKVEREAREKAKREARERAEREARENAVERELPSIPFCSSRNTSSDLDRAKGLLRSGGGQREGLGILETLVGCGGGYAMVAGRIFDPRGDGFVPPNLQLAIRFYTIAVLQHRSEGLKMLQELRDEAEGDAVLERQLENRISALQTRK